MVWQSIGNDSYECSKISVLAAFGTKKPCKIAHSWTYCSGILCNIDTSAIISSYTGHILNRHIINSLKGWFIEVGHVTCQSVIVACVRKLISELHAT
jgi:hypothetical protein